jgi:hypothetical protein
MPEYLAPGVYVEEVNTGSKPIEGVSTSTAGLIGVTERGPVHVPMLVTSYGEYRRVFGDPIDIELFTDSTPRAHCYLPHAVEGFFGNGGKRAWVVRVAPDDAERATRRLFFRDATQPIVAETVLLRPASEGTGTAVNSPLLYVLDRTNLTDGDIVRVGDGSRAEYRTVGATASARHVSLHLPLQRAHVVGASVREIIPNKPDTPKYDTADFKLLAGVSAGQSEIVVAAVTTPGDLDTLAGLLPGGTQLLEVGTSSAVDYVLATDAAVINPGEVRLTLANPLEHDHAIDTAVLAIPVEATQSLAIPANGGESLIYLDTLGSGYTDPTHLVLIDAGTANQEVRRIGEIGHLDLVVPSYEPYPAGSAVQVVTVADDAQPRQLTAPAANGAVVISLDNRQGLQERDVLRIDTDSRHEYVKVREILGPRGVSPDAGAVVLAAPLRLAHGKNDAVRGQIVTVVSADQRTLVLLAAGAGSRQLLVADGSSFAAAQVVRVTTPSGNVHYHDLTGMTPASPGEVTLDHALERSHSAGVAVAERSPLFAVRALDSGAWGNRVLVSCAEEQDGLLARAEVVSIPSPPAPGVALTLRLTTATGVEAGTVLELRDPENASRIGGFLKVRQVDRAAGNLITLDPPGLQQAHLDAHAAAQAIGQRLIACSREFRFEVLLQAAPNPAVPSRNEDILDREVLRHLSMDPRHSRYFERVVGSTFTDGDPADDLGRPLRRSDRRSEGVSAYVRVHDLGTTATAREGVRLGPETLVDVLPSGLVRPARHRLGEGEDDAARGDDSVATMTDGMYIGIDDREPEKRTGIYAFKNIDTISLVAAPGQPTAAVQQALIDHCEEQRYRFAVLDAQGPSRDSLADVQSQRQQFDTKYAAFYHPWLTIADPFPDNLAAIAQFPIPPSGHVLGIYARTDIERGVHKAPANEVVRGIGGLTRYLNKGEQDILNAYPVHIDVIRDFRPNNRGIRVWGARVITSDSDYKYVSVRRLLIFLEDSIDRGLQWVVFEPNAEELWARVRRAIVNFLTVVWRNGALEGITVEQAFFVKCDRTTMTQTDIDNGRLICVIGVAPVKPAEFVIIRIGLWTADAKN